MGTTTEKTISEAQAESIANIKAKAKGKDQETKPTAKPKKISKAEISKAKGKDKGKDPDAWFNKEDDTNDSPVVIHVPNVKSTDPVAKILNKIEGRPLKPKIDPVVKVERKLMAKYGDKIVADTVKYDDVAKKYRVTIRTVGLDGKSDGNTRNIFTSDVFQVHHIEGLKKNLKRGVKTKVEA